MKFVLKNCSITSCYNDICFKAFVLTNFVVKLFVKLAFVLKTLILVTLFHNAFGLLKVYRDFFFVIITFVLKKFVLKSWVPFILKVSLDDIQTFSANGPCSKNNLMTFAKMLLF
jgi:hypothetical protein